MPKYEVRLQSQTDDQSRRVTLSADNEDEAKAICILRERDFAAYTYDGDDYVTDDDAQLAENVLRFDDAGKVVGDADKRLRGRFQLHHQARPYVVAGIEVVQINVDRLVRELAALKHDENAWAKILDALRDEGTPTAAVTAGLFGVPMKNQYDGTAVVDWDTDTIKASLHTAYTFTQDTHDFFDDVSASEITGTGYTAGGATLGTKTATYDTATDQIRLDAADTTWTTSTLSATDAVVYKSTGVAATSPLMAAVDFGATVSTTAGTFQITWDSTGICVFDVS
jgi:hypothetical protein